MSTPDGQQGPYGPNPYQPGPQPSQAAGAQGTSAPEDDIPRQGTYNQQGTYNAYPSGGAGPSGGGYGPGGAYPPGGAGPFSYLQGAPAGFGEAIRGAMTNIVTFRGRASRSAFWWFTLFQVIAYLIVGGIYDASRPAGIVLYVIVGIPMVIAGITLAVRRLHDGDRTGWWWWIGFVPFVGGIFLLVLYLLRGTPGPNRYNVAR